MTIYFPALSKEISKPINLDDTDPEFSFFKNSIIEDFCAYGDSNVEIVKNVRISSNSVVFRYFKIFRKSCISDVAYERYTKNYRFFFKFILPKINFSKKRFLLITDEWTSNYYHWHMFSLTRILLFKKMGLLENSLLFLPKKYQRYQFALPSLEKFGVKKEQIVFLSKKSNIKVAEVALMDANQHPLILEQIRKTIVNNTSGNIDFGDKIYISREKQVLRRVENEEEVMELLKKYGFKKVIAEEFSYDEQIKIFSKAKYLIGPHGAGFTNILFMEKGSSFMEFITQPTTLNYTDYYRLASNLGINYFYQKTTVGESSQVKDFHHANMIVDVKKLEENLQLMIKNDNS